VAHIDTRSHFSGSSCLITLFLLGFYPQLHIRALPFTDGGKPVSLHAPYRSFQVVPGPLQNSFKSSNHLFSFRINGCARWCRVARLKCFGESTCLSRKKLTQRLSSVSASSPEAVFLRTRFEYVPYCDALRESHCPQTVGGSQKETRFLPSGKLCDTS